MTHGGQPCFDLLFGEIAAAFAFGKSRQSKRQRQQIEKLAVSSLNVGRLTGLVGGHAGTPLRERSAVPPRIRRRPWLPYLSF